MAEQIAVKTDSRTAFVNITSDVLENIPTGFSGVCHLFCQHTTAGLTINENADPDVVRDIDKMLDHLVPWSWSDYRHMEGNSAAHIKSSLLGPDLAVPVKDGRLALGTWQSVYFCEFDGPRSRRVLMTLTAES